MVDLETLNHFMCSDKKAHVLGLGIGIFSQWSKKKPQNPNPKPCVCVLLLIQNLHNDNITYELWANDFFKVTLCYRVLLLQLSVATFLLCHSHVLAFILPHICIYSFFLDLQLFAKTKPPKGLYVYGDVGKFHLHPMEFFLDACLLKFWSV